MIKSDVDIDVGDRNQIISKIPHIPASIIKENKIKKHNTGVYFQNIPVDPETGLSSIDYNDAENFGFIKIDFINNSIYKDIKSMNELLEYENKEPDWKLLENEHFVNKLPHLKNHFDKVKKMSPKNIHELAATLALIRPGKSHLINLDKEEILKKIWDKKYETKGYVFKKSHSYAYAKMIMIEMNKLAKIFHESQY